MIAAEPRAAVARGSRSTPAYVVTIIRRCEAHYGERARHAGMGRTFRELEIEREIADIQ